MILAAATKDALELLATVPKTSRGPRTLLSIENVEDQHLWLGMGYCVAKGYAVYRGGYDFRMTTKGRKFLAAEGRE